MKTVAVSGCLGLQGVVLCAIMAASAANVSGQVKAATDAILVPSKDVSGLVEPNAILLPNTQQHPYRSGSGREEPSSGASPESTNLSLPDAPGAALTLLPSSDSLGVSGAPRSPKTPVFKVPAVAPRYFKYIQPGQRVQSLEGGRKVVFAFHQLESPYLLLSVVTAAAYEQALNGSPNYGTNIGAYGQRVGAAAVRDVSQTLFADGVMATVLHEDPRYYIKGDGHKTLARAGYAVSRVLVTKTDAGSNVPNFSLFAGYAGAAALENAYYPETNRGFSETSKSFAGSLGGAALSNVVREFLPTILHAAHLQ